jgi:MraZ protein
LNAISLDAKGRLAIPARHRDNIANYCQGKLVVTIENDGECLVIYPVNEFEEIQRKVDALPSLDPMVKRLKRMLIGHATDVELDSNGRILLPQELRGYVGLDKKVVMVGQGKKLELWDEEAWNARREGWLKQDTGETGLSEQLQGISL